MSYPVGAGLVSFGVGVAVGALFDGCCCGGGWGWEWGCNWGPHASLYVNNNFFNHNDGNTFGNWGWWGNNYVGNGRLGWNHNPRYCGPAPTPIATSATGLIADGVAREGCNYPRTLETSGHLVRGEHRRESTWGTRPGQLPSNIGAANRTGRTRSPKPTSSERPRQPAGRRTTGRIERIGEPHLSRRVSGVDGADPEGYPGNWGGAFAGGSARWAHQFGNRGARSMGGGGFRGGGGRRRGGRRR